LPEQNASRRILLHVPPSQARKKAIAVLGKRNARDEFLLTAVSVIEKNKLGYRVSLNLVFWANSNSRACSDRLRFPVRVDSAEPNRVISQIIRGSFEQAFANNDWMIVFISDLLISHACPDATAFIRTYPDSARFPDSRFYGHMPRALIDSNGSMSALACCRQLRSASDRTYCY
jgi:hypothetical protein